MKKIILLLTIIIITAQLFSQDAEKIGQKALEELDKKNYNQAIKLLDSAFIVSGNYVYQYEKALVYYKRKNFEEVINTIESFVYKSDIPKNELYYQLLGSAYDFMGDKQGALDALNSGIVEFPNSARLYYELGVTEFGNKNFSEAVKYWDKGITKDAYYPNNYFQLMKETNAKDRKVYSFIFAEIFLNLPSSDEKKVEGSTLLYKIYKKALAKTPGLNEPKFTDYIGDYDPKEAAENPFRTSFQQIASNVYEPKPIVGLKEIVEFRVAFINEWYKKSFNELYPNPLFDYQKKLVDNDLFEIYSYLMLSSGDTEVSKNWIIQNKDQLKRYLEWQAENPIDLSTHIFNTSIYFQN